MPRKNVLSTFKAISAGDMSGALTSPVTNVAFLDNLLIQLNASGSPAGTYSVEFSADYYQDSQGNIINPGNWVAVTLNPMPTITGSGSTIIDLNQMPTSFMRVKWVPTSGSGSLDMYISAKEI